LKRLGFKLGLYRVDPSDSKAAAAAAPNEETEEPLQVV